MPPPSETDQLIQLALKSEQSGDISGALRLTRQALETARASRLPLDIAIALNSVARFRFRLGQYDAARQLAREALDLTDPTHEQQGAVHAEALLMLGMCAGETNSLVECEHYYRQAADLARETGHKLLFQRALHNLGSAVYLFRGQFELAITADSQSLQMCIENGYDDWAVFPLITLAIAYQITGQLIRTRQTLSELRSRTLPGSAGDGYAFYVGGMLAMDEDDLSLAKSQMEQAQALAEELGDPSLNLDSRLGLSRLHRRSGDYARALAWADDALNFARRVGYRIYQARALLERGRAAWLSENLLAAENDLSEAEAIFTEMDMRCDLAELHLVQASIGHQAGKPDTARLIIQIAAEVQSGGYAFLLNRERLLVYPLAAGYINDLDRPMVDAAARLMEIIQSTPPRPLRVWMLGRLEVQVGARRVDERALRQRRAGELLALLLTSPGNSLTLHQVTEAMCPEKDPDAALDFYHHAISALRRILEPDLPDRRFPCRYLDVNDEKVSLLAPPGSTSDVIEFEQFCRKKDWEQASTAYGGEFLPGFRYAEWTISWREYLSDLNENALVALAAEKLDAGSPTACLELARQVLLHTTWQEQATALGMRAAIQLGDRATAIKLYQRMEKVLEQELGIVPQKEIQQLYLEICARPRKR